MAERLGLSLDLYQPFRDFEGVTEVVPAGNLRRAEAKPEIDRLVLEQNPSVIGSGIPLFRGPFQPQPFRPIDETLLESGLRILTYDRA